MDKVKAKYVSARFKKPMENNRVFGIFTMHSADVGDFTAVGQLDETALVSDLDIVLGGKWEMHKQYGIQFKFSQQSVVRPAGEAGTIAFLMQAPGIGKQKALALWEKYGDDAAEKIVRAPHVVQKDLPAIKDAHLLAEFFKDKLIDASTRMPIISMIAGLGFPRDLPDHILARRWPDPVEAISKNPFLLLDFYGGSFLRCDALRQRLKLSPSMPERRLSAAEHVVSSISESIWTKNRVVRIQLAKILGDMKVVDDTISEALHAKKLAAIGQYLATHHDAVVEREIANWLIDKSTEKLLWPTIAMPTRLTDHQLEELDRATSNGSVAFLMGLAGTGKTTAASELIKAFSGSVIACSPTGKAAVRLSESMRSCGVQHIAATTIHKALKAVPNGSTYSFRINGQDEYLDADLVVVDEASMLHNDLFQSLIRAIEPGTRLLILGDPNQLAPIGRGSLLRDWQTFCKSTSEFTYGLLTEVVRNSGEILTTSAAIYKDAKIQIPEVQCPGYSHIRSNIQLAKANTDEEMIEKLLEFYHKVKEGTIIIPGSGYQPVDPVRDIQVILANNEGTPTSRKDINKLLQPILNPKMLGDHKRFKLNDKIIVLENKPLELASNKDISTPVNNGEIGKVVVSAQKYIHIVMDDAPQDPLVVPCGEEGGGLVDLAYAISVHKAQGSEFPIVVVLASDDYKAARVTDAGWLCTSITRAQKLCIVIGTNAKINKIRKRNFLAKRHSFLTYWMKERLKAAVPHE